MKATRIPLFSILFTLPFALLTILSACSSSDQLPPEDALYDVAIVNGRVMDPMTGRDETATVAISNGKIALVSSGSGDESEIPARSARVIDARGLVVSPGFINTHTHEGDIQESMKVYVRRRHHHLDRRELRLLPRLSDPYILRGPGAGRPLQQLRRAHRAELPPE